MDLDSMQHIVEQAQILRKPIWEVVLDYDVENRMTTPEASLEHMRATWRAMVDAADAYSSDRRSLSGLVGGDGGRMRAYYRLHDSIGGEFTAEVMAQALAMGENNACMNRIVAAPTAGACGVMPALLIPMWRREQIPEEKMVEALYVASAIGAVIATKASISGAAGGCQAEIGSASAMAAGALTYLQGGTSRQICHSVAMALKKVTPLDIGMALLLSDVLIAGGTLFLYDIRTGLFSLLGLMLKSVLVDSAIESLNRRKSFIVVTTCPEELCQFITGRLRRSATCWPATGAYSGEECTVVLTVISRGQAVVLRKYLRGLDPHAFMVVSNSSEIFGKGFLRA